MKKEKGGMLPYNTNMGLLDKMISELKNTGKDGMLVDTLWSNLSEKKNVNRKYTLNLAKYLGFIDADSKKIHLTDLGRQVSITSGEKRNILMIRNLPSEYLSMVKWILHSGGETNSQDIKVKFIENFGSVSSNILLDRMVGTFFSYGEYINTLTHTGKGRGAKVVLTDVAKKVIDSTEPIKQAEQEILKESGSDTKKPKIVIPDAMHQITIGTPERDFVWDIKSDSDWPVVEAALKSMREDWERKHDIERTKKSKSTEGVKA